MWYSCFDMITRLKHKYILLVIVAFTLYYLKQNSSYLDWNTKREEKKHEVKNYQQSDKAVNDYVISHQNPLQVTGDSNTITSSRKKELIAKRFHNHAGNIIEPTIRQPVSKRIHTRPNTLQTEEVTTKDESIYSQTDSTSEELQKQKEAYQSFKDQNQEHKTNTSFDVSSLSPQLPSRPTDTQKSQPHVNESLVEIPKAHRTTHIAGTLVNDGQSVINYPEDIGDTSQGASSKPELSNNPLTDVLISKVNDNITNVNPTIKTIAAPESSDKNNEQNHSTISTDDDRVINSFNLDVTEDDNVNNDSRIMLTDGFIIREDLNLKTRIPSPLSDDNTRFSDRIQVDDDSINKSQMIDEAAVNHVASTADEDTATSQIATSSLNVENNGYNENTSISNSNSEELEPQQGSVNENSRFSKPEYIEVNKNETKTIKTATKMTRVPLPKNISISANSNLFEEVDDADQENETEELEGGESNEQQKLNNKISKEDLEVEVEDLSIDCDDSIQTEKNKAQAAPHHCIFYNEYFDSCHIAKKYFPPKDISKELKCKSKHYKPVCMYIKRDGVDRLHCNPEHVCGKNVVKLATFNVDNGLFTYRTVRSVEALTRVIELQRSRKSSFAPFVFITCKTKSKQKLRQLLTFPDNLATEIESNENIEDTDKQRFNINIVVIDSLSRQHFYRVLPASVKTLKSINEASDSISEVLDFKGLQSLAPFTYVNIHALMNGTIDNNNYKTDNKKRSYPVQNLFKEFERKGYQTLLQEDSCWHDRWGSLLTGNEKLIKKFDKNELWSNIKKDISEWGVHDFGVTYMTCEALKKYKITSLFDSHKMLCLNGKPISSYFTDYLLEKTSRKSASQKPILSYTHINFGHEKTGRRIRGLDQDLARLMRGLSKQRNTVSIIMSDHGGKQSRYSMNTLPGRYEVYDSMFFAIVPKTLKETVGEASYSTLLNNQNSLISMLDIRDTILLLRDLNIGSKNTFQQPAKSLFSNSLTERRGCDAIGMRKYALCKCMSQNKLLNPKGDQYKDFLVWLAEYAIGQLNNKIADYSNDVTTHATTCTRIHGLDIRLALEKQTSSGVMYTFDVKTTKVAKKPDWEKDEEVFNFSILYNNKHIKTLPIITLSNWNRISIYQKYAFCQDKRVPLELCLCTWQLQVPSFEQFGIKPNLSEINNITCLLLLERQNGNVVSYEISNNCSRRVQATFTAPVLYSWQVSHKLPIEVDIEADKVMFIATFLKTVEMAEPLKPMIVIQNGGLKNFHFWN